MIKQVFGHSVSGTCNNQTLTVPIFSLNREGIGDWSKVGQHSAFLMRCANSVDCFGRHSAAQPFPLAANNWQLGITAPDQVSDHLTKATQHLLDSLLAEASARLDPNDSFAKHIR
jgi:hypothetical protein